MKKEITDQENSSAQHIQSKCSEDLGTGREAAPQDFPFRLIKNDNYRPPQKLKKRVRINDDDLPPAA